MSNPPPLSEFQTVTNLRRAGGAALQAELYLHKNNSNLWLRPFKHFKMMNQFINFFCVKPYVSLLLDKSVKHFIIQ